MTAASPSEAAIMEMSMIQRDYFERSRAGVTATIEPARQREPDSFEALLLEAFRRLSPDGKAKARAILYRMETIEAGGDRITEFHVVSRPAGGDA